jgi:hypothetical protein
MFEEELSDSASRNRLEDIRTRRRKLKQEQLKEKNDGQKNQAQGLIVNNDKAAAAAAFKEAVPNPTFEFVRTRMVEELNRTPAIRNLPLRVTPIFANKNHALNTLKMGPLLRNNLMLP